MFNILEEFDAYIKSGGKIEETDDEFEDLFILASIDYADKLKNNLISKKIIKIEQIKELEKSIRYDAIPIEDKFNLLFLIKGFVNYLNKKHNIKIEIFISKEELYVIRKNYLLILLQDESKLKNLKEKLAMSNNTHNLEKTIEAFLDGVDIYGNLVRINPFTDDGNRCSNYFDLNDMYLDMQTSVNPIGLALNNAEVYTLLVGVMRNINKDSIYYETYKNIANKIYTQLSKKTKNMIDRDCILQNVELKYLSIQEMNRKEDALLYATKGDEKINVIFRYEEQEISGIAKVKDTHNNGIFRVTIDQKPYDIHKKDFVICERLRK